MTNTEKIYSEDDVHKILTNFQWLIKNREAYYHRSSRVVVCGDGGDSIEGVLNTTIPEEE